MNYLWIKFILSSFLEKKKMMRHKLMDLKPKPYILQSEVNERKEKIYNAVKNVAKVVGIGIGVAVVAGIAYVVLNNANQTEDARMEIEVQRNKQFMAAQVRPYEPTKANIQRANMEYDSEFIKQTSSIDSVVN